MASLAVQADGKILVSGEFTALGGQARDHIGRLNPDGTLDTGFNPRANSYASSLAVQTDGKILLGGGFTKLGGQNRNYMGRLNPDGSLDTGFNPNPDLWVACLAVQADDKILIGGWFTNVNWQGHHYIARLNPDGTVDSGFNTLVEWVYETPVGSIAAQKDGKILIGGNFTWVSGGARADIARLNPDGTLDTEFNPGGGKANYSSYVSSLAVQPDGKILVGGNFTTLGGQTRNYLGRLNPDGTLDTGFNPAADGLVSSLALQADGKILVGGNFTTLGGQTRERIGRLNPDGTLDTGFNPGVGGGSYPSVSSLALQADGKILVGGRFTTLGGQSREGIGRLNATDPATHSLSYDGSTITWLRGGTSPELWRTVFDWTSDGLLWTPLGEGTYLPGGWQRTNAIVPAQATIRARGFVAGDKSSRFVEDYWGALVWLAQPVSRTNDVASTTTFSALTGGTPPLIYQWFKDGVAITDGAHTADATNAWLTLTNVQWADAGSYHLVVSNAYGSLTSIVATLTVNDPVITTSPVSQNHEPGETATLSVTVRGTAPLGYQWWKDGVALPGRTEASLTLTSLSVPDAGAYWVTVSSRYGHATSRVAGLTVNGVTVDPGFNPASGGAVLSLATQPDGKVVLGGDFSTLGGQPRSRMGRLNPDGTLDAGFNPGANNSVYSLVVQTDGKILVGGSFTTLGGQVRPRIGRLNPDGTLDPGFNPGASNYVSCLAVQADGKILVGGEFATLAGRPRSAIGRLNPDGTLDTGFNPGANYFVSSLVVQADGKILVGGYFSILGGQPRNHIGRLNADGTLDPGFNPGASNYVSCLAVQADGKILVGGFFNMPDGKSRNYLDRLNPDGTLDIEFHLEADGGVFALGLQADGKILVGGEFTTLGGAMRNRIARLNPDGTVDLEFNPGASGSVSSLAVETDGKVLVGGSFTTLGGQARSYLGRLNATGPATRSLTYEDSKITWLRGGTAPEVGRAAFEWSSDGLLWTPLGEGTRITGGWQLANVTVSPLSTLRARGFVVGGYRDGSGWFVEDYWGPLVWVAQPVSRTNDAGSIAIFGGLANGWTPLGHQWFKDGTAITDDAHIAGASTPWLTINNVLRADAGGYHLVVTNAYGTGTSVVATLTVNDPVITTSPVSQHRQAGESVLLSVAARGTAPLVYQWWKDGVLLTGRTESSIPFANMGVADAGAYSVVVTSPYGSVTSSIALVTVNGATLDTGFNPGASPSIVPVAVQADGNILVGGDFTTLGGQTRNHVARVSVDGTLDGGFNPGANRYLLSLAVQPDGKILMGGGFTTLDGQTRDRIARLNPDGTLDSGFNPGANNDVFVLMLQPDGKVLVGGGFTNLGGQPRSYVGQLNPDGTLDTGFNPGASGSVSSLMVQADGKILVGGNFAQLGGQTRNYIGRLNSDGTLDTGFNLEASGAVNSLAVQADGKILMGGNFTWLGGQPRNRIGRVNPDGTIDLAFDPGASAYVSSLVVQADGKILVGGRFATLGGQSRNGIGRLNADGTLDTGFNPRAEGASPYVNALAVQADGKILVGGEFTTLAGQARNYIARLNATDPATQNLNCDGSTVTWLRGGTSPDVWRTTFDCSTNGVDWTSLGMGTRIAGGWQLTGVDLPTNSIVRARGHTTGGNNNASSWFVESFLTISAPKVPPMLSVDTMNGPLLWFKITGSTNAQYAVETATNFPSAEESWQPVTTLTLTNGWGLFDWTNTGESGRFFRAK
jgi:uncharacterized delta-60 repeat protein